MWIVCVGITLSQYISKEWMKSPSGNKDPFEIVQVEEHSWQWAEGEPAVCSGTKCSQYFNRSDCQRVEVGDCSMRKWKLGTEGNRVGKGTNSESLTDKNWDLNQQVWFRMGVEIVIGISLDSVITQQVHCNKAGKKSIQKASQDQGRIKAADLGSISSCYTTVI